MLSRAELRKLHFAFHCVHEKGALPLHGSGFNARMEKRIIEKSLELKKCGESVLT